MYNVAVAHPDPMSAVAPGNGNHGSNGNATSEVDDRDEWL